MCPTSGRERPLMGPPSAQSPTRMGVSPLPPSLEELKQFGIRLVLNAELRMSPRRVTGLAHWFKGRMPRSSGYEFFQLILAEVQATAEYRKEVTAWVMSRDDLARFLDYSDPTGELAAWRVDFDRRQQRPLNPGVCA